jgi:signal transduction histidine kinase
VEEREGRSQALLKALIVFTGLGVLSSPITLLVPESHRDGVAALFAGSLLVEALGIALAWRGWTDTAAAGTGCGVSAVIAWSAVWMNLVTESVWFLGIGLLIASFASSPRVVAIVYLVDLVLLGLIQGRVPVLMHAGDQVPLLPSVLSLLTALALAAALNASFANRSVQRVLEANQRAEEARRVAEAANRAKSAFLANMSHELRTPLNAIIGYSDLLVEDSGSELPEDARDALDRIRRSGQHLLTLISDVLDLSKVEAERLELVLEAVDIYALGDEVSEAIAPMAATQGNTLRLTLAPGLSPLVTDRTRLLQVLLNLLTNATKFTREGQIELSAAPQSAGVLWTVRDTGIGMDSATLDRIFEPFVQGDGSFTREYGGAGLGLALCRRLSRRLGGWIVVESAVGQGSTFRLWLPQIHPEDPRAASASQGP